MAMTEEERKKIAGDAVRRELVQRERENRNWQIRVASDSSLRDAKYGETFIESPDFGRQAVEDFIAELLVDRDEWKRRAAKHGCNVDGGDPDYRRREEAVSFWRRVAMWWVCFFVGHDWVYVPSGEWAGCCRCYQKGEGKIQIAD